MYMLEEKSFALSNLVPRISRLVAPCKMRDPGSEVVRCLVLVTQHREMHGIPLNVVSSLDINFSLHLGGNGHINDYPTGRFLRDAKLYEIGAGTSEIRRWLKGEKLNSECL